MQAYCSIGDVFYGNNFGWCGPECVMHEDTFTWRKDATVKMTLQYKFDIAALLTGLEWYGIILTFLLLYSLVLTAFLSAIGKIIVTTPIIVLITHLIAVMMIAKLEKSELSIRLADKMDKIDRTWALFSNSITSILIRNLRYMSGRRRFKNGKFRFMMRISCRFFYYLIILASAFLLTRDDLTHDWFLDWRDTNMEVNELSKHLLEYLILFLILNI